MKMKGLNKFFKAQRVAIIGVSANPAKIGHIIFSNFIGARYKGEVFPVNPHEKTIEGRTCYPSVRDIKERIDLATIAVPAEFVLKAVEDCGKKGIKNIVIVTAGFKEIGNYQPEKDLQNLLRRYGMRCVGPNCLGVYDSSTGVDTLFVLTSRFQRPGPGTVSVISQSGAVGGAALELAARQNCGIAKFISYGNAADVDESDLLEYLEHDEQTKVICLYIEGVSDGKKFLNTARKVSMSKPIIGLKAGMTAAGTRAILSHTGALAGSPEIYAGVFKQAHVIWAHSLKELFDFARVLGRCVRPEGDRLQIITVAGGYGVLSADAVIENDLHLAQTSSNTRQFLKKQFPPIVTVKNPLDLTGSTTDQWYEIAIQAALKDENIDMLLIVVFYHAPLVTPRLMDILIKFNNLRKKPMVVVLTAGEYTEPVRNSLEEKGIPTFLLPHSAVLALHKLVEYYRVGT